MELPPSNSDTLDLDTRLLSNFIYELNIARRHVIAYPSQHPVIAASIGKVLALLRELLTLRESLMLGIAKDTLIIGDSFLDKNNPVYGDLARLLFGQGVAAITFSRGLTHSELLSFYNLLSLKREQIDQQGGFEQALADAGIIGIKVRPIDYSAFKTTEEELLDGTTQIIFEKQSALLWHDFVKGLLEGTLADSKALDVRTLDLDPSTLAEILNSHREQPATEQIELKSYEHTIARFLQQLDGQTRGKHKEELLWRLTAFINRLSPELRRQFLNSAFSSLAARQELAESVLSRVPEVAILDALDDLSARQSAIPQMMLDLIGKLSRNLAVKTRQLGQHHPSSADEELQKKLRILFQEDSVDKFLPDNYQKALHSIIAGHAISPADQAGIEELKQSLATQDIEEEISLIILEIINCAQTDDDAEVMQRNLLDLCSYFLSIGDFAALLPIHARMAERSASAPEDCFKEVMAVFAQPDFISEVLNGVTFWGKSKYQEIGDLIERVGEPFIEPILDRLAEEQSMSLRRYFMDRLHKIGPPVRDAAISRLRDSRWYFVRNLILVLRGLDDPSVLQQMRRLTRHPHIKVRQEAVKSLLISLDPEADAQLLRDMADSDREVMLTAVRLAEHSKSPAVLQHLTGLLSRGGLTGFDYELISTAIHSLAMIGNPSSIPGIEKFLKSRSLLRAGQLNRLKSETVQSLKHYPRQSVLGLLKDLAQSGQSDIRQVAEEIYRNMQGGDREP